MNDSPNYNLLDAKNSMSLERKHNITSIIKSIESNQSNPFKFSEIIKLERCMDEVANVDPIIASLLKKIANECWFVEPSVKIRHLNRSDVEKKSDVEFKHRGVRLLNCAQKLDDKIRGLEKRFAEVNREQQEVHSQIEQVRDTITALDKQCDKLRPQFEYRLERAKSSFEQFLDTVRIELPRFLLAITERKCVKQFAHIGEARRECIMRLLKKDSLQATQKSNGAHAAMDDATTLHNASNNNTSMMTTRSRLRSQQEQHVCASQQLSAQQELHVRQFLSDELEKHLELMMRLLRELAFVHEAFTNGVPAELEQMRTFEQMIEGLRRAPSDRLRRTKIERRASQLCSSSSINGSSKLDDLTTKCNVALAQFAPGAKYCQLRRQLEEITTNK